MSHGVKWIDKISDDHFYFIFLVLVFVLPKNNVSKSRFEWFWKCSILKILASRSYASIRLKLYSIYRWYFHLFAYEFFGYFSTFLFFTRFWCFFLCLSRGLKFRLWMKCLRCETTIELLNSHHSLFTTFFFIHHFMIYTDIQWKFFIKYSVWFKLMMFLFQHSSWCYESPYSSSPFR